MDKSLIGSFKGFLKFWSSTDTRCFCIPYLMNVVIAFSINLLPLGRKLFAAAATAAVAISAYSSRLVPRPPNADMLNSALS